MPPKTVASDSEIEGLRKHIQTCYDEGAGESIDWTTLVFVPLKKVLDRLDFAEARVKELEASKDKGYEERQRIVVGLSKLFPSWLGKHPDNDPEWERDWMNIVYVELPTGQASWHIHDSQLSWFSHLQFDPSLKWDGHSDEEKYRRVAAIAATNAVRKSDADVARQWGKDHFSADQLLDVNTNAAVNIDLPRRISSHVRTSLAEVTRERDEAIEVLRTIANHPHNSYDSRSGSSSCLEYSTGVVDGHRCAAQIAHAFLAQRSGDNAQIAREKGEGWAL